MSLRIAFDLDGVLADMDGELAHQAQLLFGERVTRRLQAQARRLLELSKGMEQLVDLRAASSS